MFTVNLLCLNVYMEIQCVLCEKRLWPCHKYGYFQIYFKSGTILFINGKYEKIVYRFKFVMWNMHLFLDIVSSKKHRMIKISDLLDCLMIVNVFMVKLKVPFLKTFYSFWHCKHLYCSLCISDFFKLFFFCNFLSSIIPCSESNIMTCSTNRSIRGIQQCNKMIY